jgi:hypothetical protein
MLEWLESIAGPQYVPAVLWTLAALAALVAILIVVKVVRRASSGTFVAGGRNRKTRLAIMDATAVDSHRRLVLVRRDDVEHLLLIGGTSDIVVEQNIRLNAPVRRPAPPEGTNQTAAQRPRPADAPPPAAGTAPRPALGGAPASRPVAQPVTQRPHEPTSEIRSIPRQAAPLPSGAAPRPAPPAAKPAVDDIDETLLHELEVSLDNERDKTAKRPEASLEEEMTRLLGELSGGKK